MSAPTFWFAERGFENSRTPCICMDNPSGGDPIIIAQVEPGFWPGYVNAMCDAATRCFRMADEFSQFAAASAVECPVPGGCAYCAEHGCPRAPVKVETHIDRECARLGHEWPPFRSETDARRTCAHCGLSQSDAA